MAWSLFAESTFVVAPGSGSQTVTLPGPPVVGDHVLVLIGCDSNQGARFVGGHGYETIFANHTGAAGFEAIVRPLPSPPPTTIAVQRHGASAVAGLIQVYRGGHPLVALDGPGKVTMDDTGAPAPGAYKTLNINTRRFIAAVLDDDDAVEAAQPPAGWGNFLAADTGQGSKSVGCTVMVASQATTLPAEVSPDPFVLAQGFGDAWQALHFALKDPQGEGLLSVEMEMVQLVLTAQGLDFGASQSAANFAGTSSFLGVTAGTSQAVATFAGSAILHGVTGGVSEGAASFVGTSGLFAISGVVDIANAVHFDGATYLRLATNLERQVNTKTITFSVWLTVEGDPIDQRHIYKSGGPGFSIFVDADKKLTIRGWDALQEPDTVIVQYVSDFTFDTASPNLVHVVASFNLANPAERIVRINGNQDAGVWTAYSNAEIGFVKAQHHVGVEFSGGNPVVNTLWIGAMADFWLALTYIDLFDDDIAALFYDDGFVPLGAIPGASPVVLLTGATDAWHLNKVGNGFTLTGTLTSYVPPQPRRSTSFIEGGSTFQAVSSTTPGSGTMGPESHLPLRWRRRRR